MITYTLPVYSEQKMGQDAAEVLRGILAESFPGDTIKFRQFKLGDTKVLVFGKPPTGEYLGIEWVQTYSIAQMMTKANATTVIAAAIKLMIGGRVQAPFQRPVGYLSAMDFITSLAVGHGPIAVDIETDGNFNDGDTVDEVNVISVAAWREGMSAPSVLHGKWSVVNGYTVPLSREAVGVAMGGLYHSSKQQLVWHNGKFDIRVIARYTGVDQKRYIPNWFDTMLAHHVLNQAAGMHGLKALAQRYLGAPEWEQGLKKYLKKGGHYEFIPTDKLIEYNGWDVFWTLELYKLLKPQIEADENYQSAFTLEMAAADMLLEVEKVGIPLDLDYIDKFKSELKHEIDTSEEMLKRITGKNDFNPRSPKQVKDWLSFNYEYVVEGTAVDIIESIRRETHNVTVQDFCDGLLAHRKASKMLGTYAEGWSSRSRDGRVHPTFLVHGTTTGRLSSTNPNAQNVPRDKRVRKMVRAHG